MAATSRILSVVRRDIEQDVRVLPLNAVDLAFDRDGRARVVESRIAVVPERGEKENT